MKTAQEIEAAIDALPRDEMAALARWWNDRQAAEWDRQMGYDSQAGRLDFLFREAADERAADTLQRWPDNSK